MASQRKKKTDKASLVIAGVLHGLLFLAITFWAASTGKLDKVLSIMGVVPQKKTEPPKEQPKAIQSKAQTPVAPVQAQDVRPPSSGTRRAVASDAPGAVGDGGFFEDNRAQAAGASTGGGGGGTAKGNEVFRAPAYSLSPILRPPPSRSSGSVIKLLETRQKSLAVSDNIGSEQISRSGSTDAAQVLTKVTGATVVDGKFAVVRGLSDRYTTSTLNGGEVPSADPYRRAAQLDLFPAAMIDSIIVTKTFTPDQPGGFAGGAINVVTKSFPEKFYFGLSLGATYNTQVTGNDRFLTFSGGQTDWLGLDDGGRKLPPELSGSNPTFPNPGSAPGQINDPARPLAERKADADKLASVLQSVGPGDFGPTHKAPPPDHNFSLSMGDTAYFLGRPLGYFAGASYYRKFSFYEDAPYANYNSPNNPTKLMSDTKAVEEVLWSTSINLALRPRDDHELGFSFLKNQNSEKEARTRVGVDYLSNPDLTLHQNTLHWTERSLQTFQFKGSHLLTELADLKTEWLVSISSTTQDEPGLRYFDFYEDQANNVNFFDPGQPEQVPLVYWRALKENNENLRLDNSLPFYQWAGLESTLKFGGYFSTSTRTLDQKAVFYSNSNGTQDPNSGSPENFPHGYLPPSSLGYDQSGGFFDFMRWIRGRAPSSASGQLDIPAGYVMADIPLVEHLRFIGGVRYEITDLQNDNIVEGVAVAGKPIQSNDLLPSLNLVVELRTNMAVRFSYSQTIARPTFREISAIRTYDAAGDLLLDGNPNLTLTSIKNYDVRWEWFPRPGEVVSASIFYKDLSLPIEKVLESATGDIVTFENRETGGTVYGVEFEVRKKLDVIDRRWENFSIGMNLALINSKVELTPVELFSKRQVNPGASSTRPLYDQSPYVFNLDFTYDNPWSGSTASIVINEAGERIYLTSSGGDDIYEQPFTQLDFFFTQRIKRSFKLRLSAKNLLDPIQKKTYGADADTKDIYSAYRKGRSFGLSMIFEY